MTLPGNKAAAATCRSSTCPTAGIPARRAIADGLSIQIAPTVATFSTRVDANRQIEELVAELNDPDYVRRKNAVIALARQPALAIPALEKMRLVANGDYLWWIDVAIQEAQANVTTEQSPTGLLGKR
jgi:hypothetical protein